MIPRTASDCDPYGELAWQEPVRAVQSRRIRIAAASQNGLPSLPAQSFLRGSHARQRTLGSRFFVRSIPVMVLRLGQLYSAVPSVVLQSSWSTVLSASSLGGAWSRWYLKPSMPCRSWFGERIADAPQKQCVIGPLWKNRLQSRSAVSFTGTVTRMRFSRYARWQNTLVRYSYHRTTIQAEVAIWRSMCFSFPQRVTFSDDCAKDSTESAWFAVLSPHLSSSRAIEPPLVANTLACRRREDGGATSQVHSGFSACGLVLSRINDSGPSRELPRTAAFSSVSFSFGVFNYRREKEPWPT